MPKGLIGLLLLLHLGVFSCRTNGDADTGITDAETRRDSAGVSDVGADYEGIWLKGDFHAHCDYSDGDSSVTEVIRFAENQNLDFFVLTEHDSSLNGKPAHWDDEAYASEKMLLLFGMEWTSNKGHANILSASPFDYAEIWRSNGNLDPEGAAQAAKAANALFSINHPNANSCPWRYVTFAGVDAVEIWNGPFGLPNGNPRTQNVFWDGLLLSGLRVPGIGGSDSHHLNGFQKNYNPPGYPCTWVFADGRDERSVIEAVRKGQVFITYSPFADRLEWSADGDGDGMFETMMGDILPVTEVKSPITFKARVIPADTDTARFHRRKYTLAIIKNGHVEKRQVVKPGKADTVYFTDTPESGSYYRLELRGNPKGSIFQNLVRGEVLAVTNPIYAGYAER